MRSRLQSSSAGTGYYMSGGSCISSQSQQVVSTSLCNLGTFLRVAAEIPPTGKNASCPSYTDGTEFQVYGSFSIRPRRSHRQLDQPESAQWQSLQRSALGQLSIRGQSSLPCSMPSPWMSCASVVSIPTTM